MKQLILLLIFTFSFLVSAVAQKTESATEEEEDEVLSEESLIKIMIIPFNPSYYKRDVNNELKQLSEKNEKKAEEVKAWFSFGLDENITPRIITLNNNERKSLVNDFSTDTDSDIKKLYAHIEYKNEKRDPKKFMKKNAMLVDNLMGKLKQGKASMNIEEDYESDKKHKDYINVYISDPTILPNVAEKYGVNLFVFINQFEIFTDYKKCLDQENKIYLRQIKLHLWRPCCNFLLSDHF
jgi:hypothetical protein